MSALKDKIDLLLMNRKLTINELSKKIKMSKQNLYKIFDRDDCKISVLYKIASVLGVPIAYFFDEAPAHGNIDVGHKVSIHGDNNGHFSVASIEECRKECNQLKDELIKAQKLIIQLQSKKKS
jgi:transcriptional regulator with XRE-family HTH domain